MQGLDWNNEDPKGWFMSEKLDGIRAYWDGTQFWSKRGLFDDDDDNNNNNDDDYNNNTNNTNDSNNNLGKLINIPESFKERLPSFHLDGELWYDFSLYRR